METMDIFIKTIQEVGILSKLAVKSRGDWGTMRHREQWDTWIIFELYYYIIDVALTIIFYLDKSVTSPRSISIGQLVALGLCPSQ